MKMTDRKTVMSWLEGLTQDDWQEWHSDSEVQTTAQAALDLLKEQEPQPVIFDRQCEAVPGWTGRRGFCPKCHQVVLWMVNREYCGFCGQAVRWNGSND